MSRVIHKLQSSSTHSVAVMQTSGSGSKYGQPAVLSTVRVKNEDLDQLFAARVRGNKEVEVIESWKVDAASQGPRSRFGKTLDAMKNELGNHLPGKSLHTVEDSISSPEQLPQLRANIEANQLREVTHKIAIPSPSEALARLRDASQQEVAPRSRRL